MCTDHKPLLTVLGPNSKPPSARIERWLLYLQQFEFIVTHIPGKENSADALSRLPVESPQGDDSSATKKYACSVVNGAVPIALTAKEIEMVSAKDTCLTMVREAATTGNWSRLSGTMYKALSDEMWVLRQIVMRGNRIVVPESLWEQVIILAHEGHQGMARTKARLREKVWWPQMDQQVEKFIKTY